MKVVKIITIFFILLLSCKGSAEKTDKKASSEEIKNIFFVIKNIPETFFLFDLLVANPILNIILSPPQECQKEDGNRKIYRDCQIMSFYFSGEITTPDNAKFYLSGVSIYFPGTAIVENGTFDILFKENLLIFYYANYKFFQIYNIEVSNTVLAYSFYNEGATFIISIGNNSSFSIVGVTDRLDINGKLTITINFLYNENKNIKLNIQSEKLSLSGCNKGEYTLNTLEEITSNLDIISNKMSLFPLRGKIAVNNISVELRDGNLIYGDFSENYEAIRGCF